MIFYMKYYSKNKDFVDGAKDMANKTYDSLAKNEMVNKTGNVAEGVGEKILDAGKKIEEKAGNIAENLGEIILDKGGDLLEKGKDLSENIGEKIHAIAGETLEKTSDLAGTILDRTNELVEKAGEEAAKYNLDNQIDEASSLGEKLEKHIMNWSPATTFIAFSKLSGVPGAGIVAGFETPVKPLQAPFQLQATGAKVLFVISSQALGL